MINVVGKASSESAINILNLRPYIPNGYCYSTVTNQEPFNSFSFKYECDEGSLTRTIYYDNLDCTGPDVDETTINKSEQGTTTIYQCDANINCDAAKISMQSAITMVCLSFVFMVINVPCACYYDYVYDICNFVCINFQKAPTSAPTDSPTSRPTPMPTTAGEQASNTAPTLVQLINVDGSSSSNGVGWSGYDCDGVSANEDSAVMDQGMYGTDVCIGVYELSIFHDDSSDTTEFPTSTSLGWYCDESKGQYFMGFFKDTACTRQYTDDDDYPSVIIGYVDDSCLPFGDDATFWTNVECNFYDGETGATIPPFGGNAGAVMYGVYAILFCLCVTILL